MKSERKQILSSLQNRYLPSIAPKYDLVLFDLDGTLMDTSEGILAAIRYTIDYFRLTPIPESRIRSFIGPPIQHSFTREYGVAPETGDEYASVFRNRYKDHDLFKARLYPGILESLKELAAMGCQLAVATYKREDYALQLLDHFGFLDFFTIAHGSDLMGKQKKSDIIQLCIQESGVNDKSRIVLVGDTDSDRIGAEEAGICFIGATYGFGFVKGDIINGSAGVIDYPAELIDYCRMFLEE